jgi:hypothetical protein
MPSRQIDSVMALNDKDNEWAELKGERGQKHTE